MPNRPHTKIKQETKTTEFKQKKTEKKKDESERKTMLGLLLSGQGGGRWFKKKQIKRKYKGKCYC